MAADYINGYSYPVLSLVSPGLTTTSYNLPLTMEEGLTEDWKPQIILIETTNLEVELSNIRRPMIRKFIGYRGYFTLDYKSWQPASNIINFESFIDLYNQNIYEMYLQPRVDSFRKYKVCMINEDEVLKILHGGSTAGGNSGIEFKFMTVDLHPTKGYHLVETVQTLMKISAQFQHNLVT